MRHKFMIFAAALAAVRAGGVISADEQFWDFKVQSTYLSQYKPAMRSLYSGDNSLRAHREKGYTYTTTAYLGVRPWPGAEFYYNYEAVQGLGFSNVQGLGGITNGEIQKVASRQVTFYRPRAYLKQTFGLGGEKQPVESDQNQLAGQVDKRRFVFTAGNLAVTDLFDRVEYAGDPRTQFMNWGHLTYNSFDFAADSRGYTYGVAGELFWDDWVLRAGRFLQPRESNGLRLNFQWRKSYGDNAEIEHAHTLFGLPGKLRLLAYRNVAEMGSFADAIVFQAVNTAPTPAVSNVRRRQAKVGFGVSIEQRVADGVGVFARLGRHDGKTETYAYAEVDHSFSAGTEVSGRHWGRANDTLGVAYMQNNLSQSHRTYLAAGGLGFFIGDGALNYAPEHVFETYYSAAVQKAFWISLGYQRIQNPAYNRDRGPVNVMSVRFHTEF